MNTIQEKIEAKVEELIEDIEDVMPSVIMNLHEDGWATQKLFYSEKLRIALTELHIATLEEASEKVQRFWQHAPNTEMASMMANGGNLISQKDVLEILRPTQPLRGEEKV